MSFDRLLIHSATITRLTQTLDAGNPVYDDMNKPVMAPATLASGVACRLVEKNVVQTLEGREVEVVSSVVLLRPRDLTEADQLQIGSRKFDVLAVLKRNAMTGEHHYAAQVREAK